MIIWERNQYTPSDGDIILWKNLEDDDNDNDEFETKVMIKKHNNICNIVKDGTIVMSMFTWELSERIYGLRLWNDYKIWNIRTK